MTPLRRFVAVLIGIVVVYAVLFVVFVGYERASYDGICPPDWTDIPARPCSLGEFMEQEVWNPFAAYILVVGFVGWTIAWLFTWGASELVIALVQTRRRNRVG